MSLILDLQKISISDIPQDDFEILGLCKIPEDKMLIIARNDYSKVEIYGANGVGISIPFEKFDGFISELKQGCSCVFILYRFEFGEDSFEIPGSKVNDAEKYLREARSSGAKHEDYKMLF